DLLAHLGGFVIEVVEHLDMVADEADWAEHDRLESLRPLGAKVVANIRFEPRIARPAAAALENERPVAPLELLGDEARRFAKLIDVAISRGHRGRNAVCREDETCA